jgi:hypothetical protein
VPRTAIQDAGDVAHELSSLHFDVTKLINGTREQMDSAFRKFYADLKGGEVGLLYYAGHALQWDGKNYMMPIDTKGDSEEALREVAFGLDSIIDSLCASGVTLGIGGLVEIGELCEMPLEERLKDVGATLRMERRFHGRQKSIHFAPLALVARGFAARGRCGGGTRSERSELPAAPAEGVEEAASGCSATTEGEGG